MSFDSLGLSEQILKAVASKGYDKPSPIQAQSIPAVLSGKDVMAAARKQALAKPLDLPYLFCSCYQKAIKQNQIKLAH